jgi:hypothetical protein
VLKLVEKAERQEEEKKALEEGIASGRKRCLKEASKGASKGQDEFHSYIAKTVMNGT